MFLCDGDLKRDEFPTRVFRIEKPKVFILNSFEQFLKPPSETLNLRDPRFRLSRCSPFTIGWTKREFCCDPAGRPTLFPLIETQSVSVGTDQRLGWVTLELVLVTTHEWTLTSYQHFGKVSHHKHHSACFSMCGAGEVWAAVWEMFSTSPDLQSCLSSSSHLCGSFLHVILMFIWSWGMMSVQLCIETFRNGDFPKGLQWLYTEEMSINCTFKGAAAGYFLQRDTLFTHKWFTVVF